MQNATQDRLPGDSSPKQASSSRSCRGFQCLSGSPVGCRASSTCSTCTIFVVEMTCGQAGLPATVTQSSRSVSAFYLSTQGPKEAGGASDRAHN
ncbi:hypothetical protein BaRGS_00014867 [Batillaria attramentaria]|uniref:Uncharacterized protein n=1 Tax=Batillaria attramentaria TaxID=370345 RepID=A0ABD0L3D4_9CAEN